MVSDHRWQASQGAEEQVQSDLPGEQADSQFHYCKGGEAGGQFHCSLGGTWEHRHLWV